MACKRTGQAEVGRTGRRGTGRGNALVARTLSRPLPALKCVQLAEAHACSSRLTSTPRLLGAQGEMTSAAASQPRDRTFLGIHAHGLGSLAQDKLRLCPYGTMREKFVRAQPSVIHAALTAARTRTEALLQALSTPEALQKLSAPGGQQINPPLWTLGQRLPRTWCSPPAAACLPTHCTLPPTERGCPAHRRPRGILLRSKLP